MSYDYSTQNTNPTQRYGAKVESWTLAQLQAHGWQARPLSQWTDQADIIIDGPAALLVEVKGAIAQRISRRVFEARPYFSSRIASPGLGSYGESHILSRSFVTATQAKLVFDCT